jgi:hypothetical protein
VNQIAFINNQQQKQQHLQNNSKYDEENDDDSSDTSTSERSTSTYDTLATLDPSYYNRENVIKLHHKDHKGKQKQIDLDSSSTTR